MFLDPFTQTQQALVLSDFMSTTNKLETFRAVGKGIFDFLVMIENLHKYRICFPQFRTVERAEGLGFKMHAYLSQGRVVIAFEFLKEFQLGTVSCVYDRVITRSKNTPPKQSEEPFFGRSECRDTPARFALHLGIDTQVIWLPVPMSLLILSRYVLPQTLLGCQALAKDTIPHPVEMLRCSNVK